MSSVLYEVSGGIARITLNRPEKRNALSAELIEETKSALDQARMARVVVLTGAGKDFCSGADLSSLQRARESGMMENMDDARRLAELFLAMRKHPRPIVAAVRGRALAGGCGLATACDIILASESAQFGYPEVNLGFVPAIVTAMLRRSVSERKAFEMIINGAPLSAPEALAAGLINGVFEDTAFEQAVQQYSEKLTTKSASALELCKRLIYQVDSMPFEGALEAGIQMNGIARMTEDCKAGIDRFLTKK